MKIDDLKANDSIIFECISGSKAYGLSIPTSDTDIKGVFILPRNEFYKLNYVAQVSDKKNDIVYYELKRFIELCYTNNPNILEMLYMPKKNILIKQPIFDKILSHNFLTKRCEHSFAGYATAQIKKAKGLNKKVFSPYDKQRKTVLDFCYIINENNTISIQEWLKNKNYNQENCGLSKINHAKQLYALYYDENKNLGYKGICKKEISNDIALSSIPKDSKLEGYLSYNPDEYSKYCRNYKDYWDWVENRNEARYENTISHQKNYDSKNMMHTFRLLNMSLEIAKTNSFCVYRNERDFLLKIRNGEFQYDELIKMANEKIELIKEAFKNNSLPKTLDENKINQILVEIRKEFYKTQV